MSAVELEEVDDNLVHLTDEHGGHVTLTRADLADLHVEISSLLGIPLLMDAKDVPGGAVFTKATGEKEYTAIALSSYKHVGLEEGWLYGVSVEDGSACQVAHGKKVKRIR